jgi:hypothetical protein
VTLDRGKQCAVKGHFDFESRGGTTHGDRLTAEMPFSFFEKKNRDIRRFE